MQVIDIRITPASDASPTSRVCFIGEGGDEVAVTIVDPHEGGSTIEQELVAKAKVMLLHAAAAQVRDATKEPEPEVDDANAGEEDGDPGLAEDVGSDPAPYPDDASLREVGEEDADEREATANGPESRSGFGIVPPG